MKARKVQGGFTIVEVVVVLILLLVVIYPLGRVIASALESTNNEQHLTHCAFLAQLKVEETRTRMNCYTNHTIAGGVNCPEAVGSHNDFHRNFDQNPCTFPYPFTKYKCTVDTGNSANARMKYIQVRVWYDLNDDDIFDQENNEPQVFLETLFTIRPPNW